jgi:hypothetical protein
MSSQSPSPDPTPTDGGTAPADARATLCVECVEEACKPCGGDAPRIGEYRLSGPQVEPGASYWNRCPVPCPVSYKDLINVTEDPSSPFYFPEYPSDPAVVQAEFAELVELERLRYDPTRVASTLPGRQRCWRATSRTRRRGWPTARR